MQTKDFEAEASAQMRRYEMIAPDDVIIVGLSGGADSMALLWFLWTQRKELHITVEAAHVNHGLREAAGQDETFVAEFCRQNGIPLHLHHAGTQNQKRSEEWARQVRYAFFETLFTRHPGKTVKIATAHTLTDQAETLLFRLARGTGLKGAAGIPAVRGCFIRPLLTLPRQATEAYCHDNGLRYVQDETNFSDRYSRNRIRQRVLPQLEQINPQSQAALGQFCSRVQGWQQYFEQQGENLLKEAAVPDGWSVTVLAQADPVIRQEALRLLTQSKRPLRQWDLPKLEKLILGECKAVQLGNDLHLEVVRNVLRWAQHTAPQAAQPQQAQAGTYQLPGGYTMELTLFEGADCEQMKKFVQSPKKGLTNLIDYDRIIGSLSLRTRQPGDVFRPAGRGGSKTLKKLMNEKHIPLHQRNLLPLLAVDSQVVWLWGEGTAEGFAPCAATRRVLVVNPLQDSMKES